jgi:16S rRNA G966 N2-methylase RsmD
MPTLVHINRQIPPLAHTPMYNWHKFWGRKTWNVVGEFVKTYCPKDGVVLDPFSGSGVTAIEALRHGRRAIAIDLNPIASEILRLTVLPVNINLLNEAFERVRKAVEKSIQELYLTKCRNCGRNIPIASSVWKRDERKRLKMIEVRYKCPHCEDAQEKDCAPNRDDLRRVSQAERRLADCKLWYPKNRLYYPDGKPFKEKQQYESLDELFTPRNLYALALLMNQIENEEDERLRDYLKIGFTSMVHLCSTMVAVSDPAPTSHHTAFASTGWTQHSYWFAREFMEQNVWMKYESALLGHQGLIKAKGESSRVFDGIKPVSRLEPVLESKADLAIVTGSCLDIMQKMPEGSVDYVFTDPPYDASIQYGELAYLWVAWLKKDRGYLESLCADEVVRNERQQKNFEVYETLLKRGFQGIFRVLKPEHHLTLTFHNPTFAVRNATIRAATFAGFEFQKVHHQPTAQKSGKSLLQPFGSAMGDFYLRFGKPRSRHTKLRLEALDELRFEKIVVEATTQILADRAEPTPYTLIINYIDPILARNGYFSTLTTGLDVKTVLKSHEGVEFKLVEAKLGGASGKVWWFKDPMFVARLKEVPLSERVEQTVYRLLHSRGKVSFTEAWDAVSTEFPNSLTSDSTSIKEALQEFAIQVAGGFWRLKPQVRVRVSQHSETIAILAEAGKVLGYKIAIGKREQYEVVSGLMGEKRLSEWVTVDIKDISGIENVKDVELIDLLWVKREKIATAFEVESTTGMTSGLVRCSNLPSGVDRYLVIPEERHQQLRRKMLSPMFKEHFERDDWKVLYFDALRNAYQKLSKGKASLGKLVGLRAVSKNPGGTRITDQQILNL